jgi:cytochrome c biogenesis factor
MNRSGIESSVHAFETRGLGIPFVTLIAATLLISFALVYWRLPGLAAANRLDSFFSRESAFLMSIVAPHTTLL